MIWILCVFVVLCVCVLFCVLNYETRGGCGMAFPGPSFKKQKKTEYLVSPTPLLRQGRRLLRFPGSPFLSSFSLLSRSRKLGREIIMNHSPAQTKKVFSSGCVFLRHCYGDSVVVLFLSVWLGEGLLVIVCSHPHEVLGQLDTVAEPH